MIKRNFDRVWGQIEDMFQDFREKMESDTQRALLKVDEEVSTLRTQLQNQSPPSNFDALYSFQNYPFSIFLFTNQKKNISHW
jgi:hypothetical protein